MPVAPPVEIVAMKTMAAAALQRVNFFPLNSGKIAGKSGTIAESYAAGATMLI
jgi:hypothetical protein